MGERPESSERDQAQRQSRLTSSNGICTTRLQTNGSPNTKKRTPAMWRRKQGQNLHLLCRCPALACKRYKSWGHMFLTPKDLENAKVSSLINLISDTRLGSTE
ncbi:hypothetical protein ALC62_14332 [Cyphomyrmex costatus]|uniref:Uncharacterized protein n=1 Tax=Cyphomyrmex costatus TaxID=456900 RepID=A0A151I8Q2_9HYME|nr:hypothetical protein ALC62_14332 [Cyphomyrmex costatus]